MLGQAPPPPRAPRTLGGYILPLCVSPLLPTPSVPPLHLWAHSPVLFVIATENLPSCTYTHLLSWPEGLPTPQYLPAGNFQRALGQGFWEHSPVHEDPGQERTPDDTSAGAQSKGGVSLMVTPGRAGQERTDQQAALTVQYRPYPALSCQSGVAPATWITLAGHGWRARSPAPDLPALTCHEGD